MLEIIDVGYAYGNSPDGAVLSAVSLEVRPGEIVALLGPNGSGKSTLALLAAGLLSPHTGSVRVDGVGSGDSESDAVFRRSVGIVFQDPDNQIVGTVVEEDVAFGPENLGIPREELRRRVDSALSRTGLTGLERREPHTLSGGQKQRLAIAGALAMRPAYLVLDEPTAMLDPAGREDVSRIVAGLKSAGTGVLHVTHSVLEAMHADRAVVLLGGRVAYDGPPAGLALRESDLRAWSLALPPVLRLAEEMRRLGHAIPAHAASAEEIAGALWG